MVQTPLFFCFHWVLLLRASERKGLKETPDTSWPLSNVVFLDLFFVLKSGQHNIFLGGLLIRIKGSGVSVYHSPGSFHSQTLAGPAVAQGAAREPAVAPRVHAGGPGPRGGHRFTSRPLTRRVPLADVVHFGGPRREEKFALAN